MTANKFVITVSFVLATCILSFPGASHAQCPSSSIELYRLTQAYEAGRFNEILCLQNCVTALPKEITHADQEQRIRHGLSESAYHGLEVHFVEEFLTLFIKAAFAVDSIGPAMVAIRELLVLDPSYKPNPQEDPYRMVTLLDSFIPYASDLFGITGGAGLTIVHPLDIQPLYYGLDNADIQPLIPDYRNRPSYNIGLEWIHYLTYHHGISTGLSMDMPSFQTRLHSPNQEFNPATPLDKTWQSVQTEELTLLQGQLLYQYRLPLLRSDAGGTTSMIFHAGGYGSYLISASSDITLTHWEMLDTLMTRLYQTSLSEVASRRVRFSGGIDAGAGIQVDKIGFSWFLRASMMVGLTQMREANSEYNISISEAIWNGHISDNNFRINSANLCLGLMLNKGNKVKIRCAK